MPIPSHSPFFELCKSLKNLDVFRTAGSVKISMNQSQFMTTTKIDKQTCVPLTKLIGILEMNILKRNGYHCYKEQTPQEVFRQDHIGLMEFCETMTMKNKMKLIFFLQDVLFTEVFVFFTWKTKSIRCPIYWSRKISIRVFLCVVNTHKNLMFGILGDKITVPFFIDSNLNAVKYLQLLKNINYFNSSACYF